MNEITFQYPAWLLALCALLGIGYAALLYFRDKTFQNQPPAFTRWLAFLRWLTVTILSALLLTPMLKSLLTETKKPVVVLAQDVSESIGLALQGPQLEQYKTDFEGLKNALSENYEVHALAFGDQVREGVDFNFTDKVSNLSEALKSVHDMYGAQNLGAIVLASDGIYNEGSNPAYAGAQIAAPVFTVALGDTSQKRDLFVKRVFHNKIAYLGDKFTVQVDVAATNCNGAQSVLTVTKTDGETGKILQSIPVTINKNDFFTTKEITLNADKAGVARYLISVAKIPNEVSGTNNSKEIFIDILDARQKILILANAPHPDISALRQMLETNQNYAVATAHIGDAGVDVTKHDFVVLHNLPSQTNDISGLINTMNNSRVPRLFITGTQTNFGVFSRLQGLVTAQSDGRQTDDVQGKLEPKFAAFTLDGRVAGELPKFNPVLSPFGNFGVTPQGQTILWKRIGKVDTQQPLLVVGEANGIKTGVFLGENLWKWRMFDYLQFQNHAIFDELFGKTVQYLALKEDKRKFRVNFDKNVFNENEAVVFSAELYNDNYELINEPDVAMLLKNSEGKEFSYIFNKLGKAYNLNAGILPTGNYTYRASVTFNGQNQVFDGQFSVRPIQMELFETTANHAALRQLSKQYGGETIAASQLSSLAEKIANNNAIKPVIYQTSKTSPFINLKWIFGLLALLLAAEWFLRRYFGSY